MSARNKWGNKSWREKVKKCVKSILCRLGTDPWVWNSNTQSQQANIEIRPKSGKIIVVKLKNSLNVDKYFLLDYFSSEYLTPGWMGFKSLWAKLTEATLNFDSSFFIKRHVLELSVIKKRRWLSAQDVGISMFPLQLPNLMELPSSPPLWRSGYPI